MEHSSLIARAAEVVGGGTMDGWGGMGLGRMDGWGDRGRCGMGLGRYGIGEGPAIAIIIQVTRGIDQRPANWPVSAAIPAIWNLEKGKLSKWSVQLFQLATKKDCTDLIIVWLTTCQRSQIKQSKRADSHNIVNGSVKSVAFSENNNFQLRAVSCLCRSGDNSQLRRVGAQ